ncbi:hypothetical protein ACFE04_015465 [Oxalis oulophora]
MGSTVIAIPDEEVGNSITRKNIKAKFQFCLHANDTRKIIHSVKVGIALVLVSLLYLLDPLYEQVGNNAMWAIMTVVVIFEFFAGATLSKGLNRGLGTVLGGSIGCLTAAFAQQVGGISGNAIVVAISLFVFGGVATYSRLVPRIKKTYDYGAMIFILTFSLVAVSGLRAGEIMKLARERLSTIVMGFAVCIFINLLVFPVWASDELHHSLSSHFESLAHSIEGCVEEYFKPVCNNEKQNKANPVFSFSGCKSVLHSKAKEEQLANFARWEPWHGKFGFSYPWNKYLQIAEVHRELAVTILSFKACLQSPGQASESMKEPCVTAGKSLAWIIRELGESMKCLQKCKTGNLIESRLKSTRAELSKVTPGIFENSQGVANASFLFSLMEIVEQVEGLVKDLDELARLANFSKK